MQTLADLDDASITRLIIRMRRRLVEAERRLPDDPDEASVVATILPTLRQIAVERPHLAPKLEALISRYTPLAATAH